MDSSDIDQIFEKIFTTLEKEIAKKEEEYIPYVNTTITPDYVATPINELKHVGPKRLTIEEYKKRQKKPLTAPTTPPIKKKRRGGRKVKLRRQRKELHRLISITDGEEQKSLFKKLRNLQQEWETAKRPLKRISSSSTANPSLQPE